MKTKTKYSPFEKLVEGLGDCLTGESAKRVLEFRVDAKLQKQIDQLGDKCSDANLTPEERAEYEDIVALDGFIAILKSKLRQRQKNKGE